MDKHKLKKTGQQRYDILLEGKVVGSVYKTISWGREVWRHSRESQPSLGYRTRKIAVFYCLDAYKESGT